MVKKDKKYNFDLVTPADAVDYDPLAGEINNDNIKPTKNIKRTIFSTNFINRNFLKNLIKSIKNFRFKYITFNMISSKNTILIKYSSVIIISVVLSFVRWSFLDEEFPLIGLSENQIKAIKIKEISEHQTSQIIDLKLMQKIVDDNLFPLLDARDLNSYNEGHIKFSYHIDSDLLIESDDEELEKFKNIMNEIINQGHQTLVIYCWNPDCDRAEYLKAIILDDSGYYGSFNNDFNESNILIYEQGWDEWSMFSTNDKK